MKFIKENKLAVLSIAVFVLVAILLAIPGQFSHFGAVGENKYTHMLSGYETIFNTYKFLDNPLGDSVIASGVAIIVLIPFAVALTFLGKKSSFFVLLASLLTIAIAILFFTMEGATRAAYARQTFYEGRSACGWVPYLCGALVILLGLYLGYKTVMMMKDEIKHPSQPKGPSYNYLKK